MNIQNTIVAINQMLDALRERALPIRPAKSLPESGVLRDELPPYQVQVKQSG